MKVIAQFFGQSENNLVSTDFQPFMEKEQNEKKLKK